VYLLIRAPLPQLPQLFLVEGAMASPGRDYTRPNLPNIA
jgi:hypothetical protein